MESIFIIAEAGVNHNGDHEKAFQLVDMAVEAGVDAVKFQTFKAENVVTENAEKATYQKKTTGNTESQFEMLKRLELPHEVHHELKSYCKGKNIKFLSTAFDSESLDFLVNDLGLKNLKIPSGEITNGPLLLAHAQTGCDLILSTGMATLGEVEEALAVLAFGFLNSTNMKLKPSREAFLEAFLSESGQKVLKEKVSILHCTTEYPAPLQEINLNAMITMRNAFGLETGYSDHSEGIIVPTAAAAMGARIIEKHFTLDKSLPGPDHKASLEYGELSEMVNAIRTVEQVLGDGVKVPVFSELKNRAVVRRSLVARTGIQRGDVISKEMVSILRPCGGKSPMEYWDVVGETQLTTICKGENF